jgi:hypothetical protein
VKFAKLLEIQYQGYFFCRLATDPDPTNEQRGVSGYTMALVHEDPLDQVVRTQIDREFAERNLREPVRLPGEEKDPNRPMDLKVGVEVSGVSFDGKSYEPAARALTGAKLSLKGKTPPFDGPIFDSRNNIVGSDDNMMFVVNPFELEIKSDRVTIEATDYLNPADPTQQIWQIEDPSTYSRRLPTAFSGSSTTAMAAIRVFDGYGYFRDRRRFLEQRIAALEAERAAGGSSAERDARIEALRTRIYQLEFWGDRVISKLGFQLTYSFNVNGPQRISGAEHLGGEVDFEHPWPVTFWFGSWDGDLLIGYMQGSLGIPFQPAHR